MAGKRIYFAGSIRGGRTDAALSRYAADIIADISRGREASDEEYII